MFFFWSLPITNMGTLLLVLYVIFFPSVYCPSPPIGDEVQPGSVLLPATRRGRYLANIVRRQAVDGTGIKFNKDADRMNAEAKKKVDVLSEELLPYIIAEQERRTTLYKRVMTAIQNGEKGVTIAEMRNKPPLFIRKGLMFRCPSNRAPREPDGTGSIMCEDDIEPSPVMFDSCLSAEDKELYVADNRYFFCNRHRVEGPDLPRNGSTVIGCAPTERTSLNYTSRRCALEDTDDVVVHYRYYPDRTYKYVTELDPDREVCDHWNPCQIGYIFSLPSPDMAIPANELWQDSREENVHPSVSTYTTVPRRVAIPPGYGFDSVWRRRQPYSNDEHPSFKLTRPYLKQLSHDGSSITLSLTLPWNEGRYGSYYAIMTPIDDARRNSKTRREKSLEFIELKRASVLVMEPKVVEMLPGQQADNVSVEFRCIKCELSRIMIRGVDWNVYNLDPNRFQVIETLDRQKNIVVDLNNTTPKDMGIYMAYFLNDQKLEEIIKFLTIQAPAPVMKSTKLRVSANVGDHLDSTVAFTCDDCDLNDILCNGESVLPSGRVTILRGPKTISFNFPSFEDTYGCVYVGLFKQADKTYRKVLAVIERVSLTPVIVASPPEGEQFEVDIPLSCEECTVEKVTVNGIALDMAPTRRTGTGPLAYYISTPTSITIRISAYINLYDGIYQALFDVRGEQVTKTILEVRNEDKEGSDLEGDPRGCNPATDSAAPAAPATPAGPSAPATPTAPTGGAATPTGLATTT